jgi:hypothetical protein
MSAQRLILMLLTSLGVAGGSLVGSAPALAVCPNEGLRFGRSAALPDCRVYELVTPGNLGRTQDMTFGGQDHAIPSSDGEQLVLETLAPIEPPNQTSGIASETGTRVEFVRTPHGWSMKPGITPGMAGDNLEIDVLGPNLEQVAFDDEAGINETQNEAAPKTLLVGPWGGPYETAATVPHDGNIGAGTALVAANNGTASVPAFSDVLFYSGDHALLPPGPERTVAEGTLEGEPDLYDWTDGHLELVNVEGDGPTLKLVNKCGAGTSGNGPVNINTVSADGSKIFFTTHGSGPTCQGPNVLYMRVDGRETVEVANDVADCQSGATPSGSAVFFVNEGNNGLYEYATEAPMGQRLKLITADAPFFCGFSRGFTLSEDGSTAYFEQGRGEIQRYEVDSGKPPVTIMHREEAATEDEIWSVSANGQFLLIPAAGVEGEPRGKGRGDANETQQLYRYDNATKSVICVSCGEGDGPVGGGALERASEAKGALETEDLTPRFIRISENGQRVFFQTNAKLVPQDINEVNPVTDEGQDVYEWEAQGTEEELGVFCRVVNGCTHLISSGEDVGPAVLLGASNNGDNVFFATAATLAPNATPEFSNIYDARVDGGFQPAPVTPECSSCQGVGSPPLVFSPGASLTFVGVGNVPSQSSSPSLETPTKKPAKCAKDRKLEHGKCVKAKVRGGKRARRAKRAISNKGGKRS